MHDRAIQGERVIYREEVTAILQLLARLNARPRQIHELLKEDFDGAEEIEEDGS